MASSIAPSSSVSNLTPNHSTIAIPYNFHTVFARDYPDSIPERRGSQQRTTKGTARWSCTACTTIPRWATRVRSNAIRHCINNHPIATPSSAQQSSITSHFSSISSVPADKLRNVFNQEAYKEAIVGLLCRRRLSFAAVD
jgi:hypothetical protein